MRGVKRKYQYMYLVVYVWRGVEISVSKFDDYLSAKKKQMLIEDNLNPDYDEVAFFKKRR
jgi:hypothetical protein